MMPFDEETPLWMRAVLTKLESAFPAFSFAVRRSRQGFRFEAWRDPAAAGLYAVITGDLGELWRELMIGAAMTARLAADTGQ